MRSFSRFRRRNCGSFFRMPSGRRRLNRSEATPVRLPTPSRASRFACLGFLSLATLEAQAPGEPYFRVSTSLVQVDSVVTDSKRRYIRDLEAADFQILEDGKAQKITSFFWV